MSFHQMAPTTRLTQAGSHAAQPPSRSSASLAREDSGGSRSVPAPPTSGFFWTKCSLPQHPLPPPSPTGAGSGARPSPAAAHRLWTPGSQGIPGGSSEGCLEHVKGELKEEGRRLPADLSGGLRLGCRGCAACLRRGR